MAAKTVPLDWDVERLPVQRRMARAVERSPVRKAPEIARPLERQLKAVLFDLDGTLTDPKEGITRCIAYALEKMGVKAPPFEELTFAIGPPLRPSLARLIGSDDRDDVEAALVL